MQFSVLTSKYGFICQTPSFPVSIVHLHLEDFTLGHRDRCYYLKVRNLPVLPTEKDIVSTLSPVQHCRSGSFDLGQRCVTVGDQDYKFADSKEICHNLYNGDIAADVTEVTHTRISSILGTLSHFGLRR